MGGGGRVCALITKTCTSAAEGVDMSTEPSDAEWPRGSSGLTSIEATRLLAEDGPNEPAPTRRLSGVVEIARLFANPLVLILLVASGVSAWLGEKVDAGII